MSISVALPALRLRSRLVSGDERSDRRENPVETAATGMPEPAQSLDGDRDEVVIRRRQRRPWIPRCSAPSACRMSAAPVVSP